MLSAEMAREISTLDYKSRLSLIDARILEAARLGLFHIEYPCDPRNPKVEKELYESGYDIEFLSHFWHGIVYRISWNDRSESLLRQKRRDL